MKVHAFIFARGGSKGLPGKNIKVLAGKPLLVHSIEIAKKSAMIDSVFVSTDDDDIARVANQNGAIVIKRPDDLATDTSPEWLAWRHAINWVNDYVGKFDIFISLPATSPVRLLTDVEASIKKIGNEEGDICISVSKTNRNPFFNVVKINELGLAELMNKPENSITRRQDAPQAFDIITSFYTTTPQFVHEHYGLFEGKVTYIEVARQYAVDIDDIYDFKFAEIMMKEVTCE